MVHKVPDSMTIFAGNANPELAKAVANSLNIPLGHATVSRFSDGEVMVQLLDSVRGRDVFVLQSTCAPTNDNLMELMIMVDALKRASAARITAAIPYYGYARQDRRPRSTRVAISAKVVANMLQAAGVNRVLTMDLHADQIQGFFDIPVDNIYATPVLLKDLLTHNYPDLMVVSPDVGGVVRARAMAKALECDLAIIDKRRPHLRHHRRHRRHRRHALQRRRRPEGTRRQARRRLHHAPGSLRFRRRTHHELGSRRTRRDRHDSALRSGPRLQQDPSGLLRRHHR